MKDKSKVPDQTTPGTLIDTYFDLLSETDKRNVIAIANRAQAKAALQGLVKIVRTEETQ